MGLRDWSRYNDELVKRGEIPNLPRIYGEMKTKNLKEMNKGKRGRPYKFPCSFVRFSSNVVFGFPSHFPYRAIGRAKRGWIKVHVAVDAEEGELQSLEATDEGVHDTEMFPSLVEEF